MGGTGSYYKVSEPLESFKKKIISVKEEKNEHVHCPEKKRRPEMQIDGMFEGWLLYIVAMAISAIFKDVILFWGLWSWIFFSWRQGKIAKEGYYYE